MDIAVVLVVLAVLAIGGTALSDRLGVPAPMLLIVVGVIASFLPFVPNVHLSPEVVLIGLLPPLLYSTAISTSLIDIRANAWTVGLLSVALVVVTTLTVGSVMMLLLPDLGWPVAIAVGAVVAPPDAVAASAVARRIGLPREIVTILEAESLLNDATALVALRTAIAAIAGGVGIVQIGGDFVLAAGGGLLVGVATFVVVGWLRKHLNDSLVDTAISFVTPFAAYLLAEHFDASGVIAVVAAGLLLGHKAPILQTASSRITEAITWRTVAFLLENAVFLLLGLQADEILDAVAGSDLSATRVVMVCALTLVTVVLTRLIWVVSVEWLRDRRRAIEERTSLAERIIIGWAGMRGVVTLAAALLIPIDAPHRDVIVLVALTTVLGTLFLQGLSLPWLARRLHVQGPDPAVDALARATLLQQAGLAGLRRMAQTDLGDDTYDEHADDAGVRDLIRSRLDQRAFAAWERLSTAEGQETPSEVYSRLRLDMIDAERTRILEIRSEGRVPSDVVRQVLAMLDIEESMLDSGTQARAGITSSTLSGTGPGCAELMAQPAIDTAERPSCARCVEEGTRSIALRQCLTCGNIGCCDSSMGQHASAHHHLTGHPVMESAEPGETWRWCYVHHLTA